MSGLPESFRIPISCKFVLEWCGDSQTKSDGTKTKSTRIPRAQREAKHFARCNVLAKPMPFALEHFTEHRCHSRNPHGSPNTQVKILVVLLVIAVGSMRVQSDNWHPFFPNLGMH